MATRPGTHCGLGVYLRGGRAGPSGALGRSARVVERSVSRTPEPSRVFKGHAGLREAVERRRLHELRDAAGAHYSAIHAVDHEEDDVWRCRRGDGCREQQRDGGRHGCRQFSVSSLWMFCESV